MRVRSLLCLTLVLALASLASAQSLPPSNVTTFIIKYACVCAWRVRVQAQNAKHADIGSNNTVWTCLRSNAGPRP